MSSTILVVKKFGSINEIKINEFNELELYKIAGFNNADNFLLQNEWFSKINGKRYYIHLYGNTEGKSGQENKYEFPPPLDNSLFFGNCLLINYHNDKLKNISKKEWKKIYNDLYGGFEDIGEDDSYEDSEDDVDSNAPRTKEGYIKDDFVVDDEESVHEETDNNLQDIIDEDDSDYTYLSNSSSDGEEYYEEYDHYTDFINEVIIPRNLKNYIDWYKKLKAPKNKNKKLKGQEYMKWYESLPQALDENGTPLNEYAYVSWYLSLPQALDENGCALDEEKYNKWFSHLPQVFEKYGGNKRLNESEYKNWYNKLPQGVRRTETILPVKDYIKKHFSHLPENQYNVIRRMNGLPPTIGDTYKNNIYLVEEEYI